MTDKSPQRIRLSLSGCIAAGLYLAVMLWAVSVDRSTAGWGSPLAGMWTFIVMLPVAVWMNSSGAWYSDNWLTLLAICISMLWMYVVVAAIAGAIGARAKRP